MLSKQDRSVTLLVYYEYNLIRPDLAQAEIYTVRLIKVPGLDQNRGTEENNQATGETITGFIDLTKPK